MAGYMGMPGVSAPAFDPNTTAGSAPWGAGPDGTTPVNGVEQPTGTQGGKGTVPYVDLYAGYNDYVNGTTYTGGNGRTMSRRAGLGDALDRHIFEPFPATRQGYQLGAYDTDTGTYDNPVKVGDGRGREYMGPWVNPWNTDLYKGEGYRHNNGVFKYNQMLMTTEQSFDPFIQKNVMEYPYQWINRIPRRAYQLHNGLVHETNIFRGGLEVYSGLSDWEPLQADPREKDPCGPMKYRTYDYAWEKMMWSGMKTAWGSDPFCIDLFKFVPDAMEQLGWIIEAGARFGIAIQNIWNRDNFIKFSVQAGRSYVMSKEYRGTSSARYVYEPLCKFADGIATGSTTPAPLVADRSLTNGGRPFFVVSAEVEMEPINYQTLQILRRELTRAARDAAIASLAGEPVFGIGINSDDVDNFIRGNEEERRYYIEGAPLTLSKGYNFVGTNTFRKWVTMEDGDQLRGNVIGYIGEYTEAEAAKYGYVGYKELAGKPVFIVGVVDPVRAGRPGINGSPIPEPNPEYDLAEVAIAPVFLDMVYTNEFVPDENTLGHGTWFGPKEGLNGKWKWYNIQTEDNPDQRVGNFRGLFEIVPKPEKHAIYATSFVYRRCAQPLKSLCPAENKALNPAVDTASAEVASAEFDAVAMTAELLLKADMVSKSGDSVTVKLAARTKGVYSDGVLYAYNGTTAADGKLSYTADDVDGTKVASWTITVGAKAYTVDDGATLISAIDGTTGAGISTFFGTERTLTNGSGESKTEIKAKWLSEQPADIAYEAMVYSAPTQRVKNIQFTGSSKPAADADLTGATFAKKVTA